MRCAERAEGRVAPDRLSGKRDAWAEDPPSFYDYGRREGTAFLYGPVSEAGRSRSLLPTDD